MFIPRDVADPTAFAQRIHSSLAACVNPTGQWIRIIRPSQFLEEFPVELVEKWNVGNENPWSDEEPF